MLDTSSSDGGLNNLLEKYEEEAEVEQSEENSCFGNEQENMSETDIADEIAALDEKNSKKTVSMHTKKEDLTHIYQLMCAMYREGAEGSIDADEYSFLEVFREGTEKAAEKLRNEAADLFSSVEEEMKSAYWRRLNKQKPIRQRIKQSIAEKRKKEIDRYKDIPFITEITKDFCYRTGMRIPAPVSQKIKDKRVAKNKIDTKVHEKMQGFYTPTVGYVWEEDKNSQFIEYVFKE